MYKKILILVVMSLFICGCSIEKLNVNHYDELVDKVLLKKHNLKNRAFQGYSYYIPHGLSFLNQEEENSLLIDQYQNYYYVYVDVVSYYNQVSSTYKKDKNSYYSLKIEDKNGKKNGYLEINQVEGQYFVEAMYNYAKIEVYTTKKYLSDVVINVCEMLSSVKYNHKVLATTIGDKVLDYKEESFNIFTTKKSNSNYLDYIEKYDSGAVTSRNEKNAVDEDMFDVTIEDD